MFRRFVLLCYVVPFVVAATGFVTADETLRTAADRPIDILHIRLDLDVSLKSKSVSGTATIDFQPNREVSSISLDAVGLDVTRVERIREGNKQPLDFSSTGDSLLVEFQTPLDRQQQERIAIAYRVDNPQSGLHFFGPTEDDPKTPWMVWSQGEPRANRYWFPCVDHPIERQTTEVIARVPAAFTVLSNGSLVQQTTIEDGKRIQFHWKQSKPHVAYLVTLVAGKFAVIEETWNDRPVTYYVMPDREADAKRTFGRTREMLDFFSERFGDYPWEKYAQVVVEQFTSGGMENTSATTLYQGVMHDERAMLDSSPDRLIAHELGHQWWGDLVTCRDWAHLWLNEGFATYCEVMWYEHKLGIDERDYLLYQKSRSARTGSPLERPVVDRRYSSPRTMFDARSYPKGGWVLHMLRQQLGDEDFYRGLKRYGVVFAYQTAETSDFRKVFEQLYGVSLERFFYDWTERKGHPLISVKSEYDPEDRLMRIDIKQTQTDEAFHFLLEIELTGAGEDGIPILSRQMITGKEQTLLVPVKQRPTLVRVDPRFTLLADIKEEKAVDWWNGQLTAPTVAERIRAIEHLGTSKKQKDLESLAKVLQEDPFYGVRIEAAKELGKQVKKVSETALVEGLGQPHPKVRRACAQALSKFKNNDCVEQALLAKEKAGDPSYYVIAAVVQSLATASEKPDVNRLRSALEQDSHRDVIRSAALRGLGKSKDPQALRTLIEWTGRDHTRDSRLTSIATLGEALKENDLTPEQQELALSTLADLLSDSGPRIRRSTLQALGKVPELAKSRKSKIEALANQDAIESVRVDAEKLLKQMDTTGSEKQLIGELRTELDELKKQNSKLQERLERLEQKE